MANMLWRIRQWGEQFNPYECYCNVSYWFTFKVHHSGSFEENEDGDKVVYESGRIDYVDFINGEYLSMYEINLMGRKLGVDGSVPLQYFYKIPFGDISSGMRPLGNDDDTRNMIQYVREHKVIEVYIHPGEDILIDFLHPTRLRSSVVIEELIDRNVDSGVSDVNRVNRGRLLAIEDNVDNVGNVDSVGNVGNVDSVGNVGNVDNVDTVNNVDNLDSVDEGTNEDNVGTVGNGQGADNVREMDFYTSEQLNELIEEIGGEKERDKVLTTLSDLKQSGYTWDDDVLPQWLRDEMQGEMMNEENGKDDGEARANMDEGVMNKNKEKGKRKAESDDESDNDIDDDSDVDYEAEWDGITKAGLMNDDEEMDEDIQWDERKSICDSDEEIEPLPSNNNVDFTEEDRQVDSPAPFYVGQLFTGPGVIKDEIKEYAIKNKRDINIVYNDKRRVRAVCEGNDDCPWTVHASWNKVKASWQMKTYVKVHRCNTSQVNRYATANWLAKQYKETVRENPNWPASAFVAQVFRDHQQEVSTDKVYRAKKKAETILHGSFRAQYRMLRDYCQELIKEMPGSTIKIDLEDPTSDTEGRRFRRVYICLDPLKQGFLSGCRKIIGLDGAFVKGPFPRQLLTAVGIDANNGIYPVAYAVVEVENYSSWKWFLELLKEDLNIQNEFNWSIISDEQKGLVPAVEEVLPNVEHRFCVYHMYKNYKKKFKGEEMKNLLFAAATTYNSRRFAYVLEDIKKKSKEAFDWITAHPKEHWARSQFRPDIKSDILYNNLCECLNSKVAGVRDKPLLGLLEGMRNYLMKRIMMVRKKINKCNGQLCPKIQEAFEKIKNDASEFICNWNGDTKYQLAGPYGEQCHCDLKLRTCSCNRWDLTGIPCKHAVSAIYMHGKNEGNGVPEDWVHVEYKLDTWKVIYSHTLNPLNGPTLWDHQEQMVQLLPHIHHVQPGRPRKQRRKDKDEGTRSGTSQSQSKLTRKGSVMHCSLCGNKGHNSKTCKGQGGESSQTVKEKRRPGRPKKNKDIQAPSDGTSQADQANEGGQCTQNQAGEENGQAGEDNGQGGRVLRSGRMLFAAKEKKLKGKSTN